MAGTEGDLDPVTNTAEPARRWKEYARQSMGVIADKREQPTGASNHSDIYGTTEPVNDMDDLL